MLTLLRLVQSHFLPGENHHEETCRQHSFKALSPMAQRVLKWLAAGLLALPLLALLWIAIFGWNWARAPLQRLALEKTGRALLIAGDLQVDLDWPAPRLRAKSVTFANPVWARERQMLASDEVELTFDIVELLRGKVVLPDVRLIRPLLFLERSGERRKSWLLDKAQSDEEPLISIQRLTLDQGRLGYDDEAQNTHLRGTLSTQGLTSGGATGTGVNFAAEGLYKGLKLAARGSGGPVLALRDESQPYPLKVDATIGDTGIQANGSVTSLLKFSAVDLRLALRGGNLAQLFPLVGMALPKTRAYAMSGHLTHSGTLWRYEKFSGRIGNSDLSGNAQVDTVGARPFMRGDLVSSLLDLDDLGPLIGSSARQTGKPQSASSHILPEIPFQPEHWNSVDADVSLKAHRIARAKALPLENLVTRLKMQDSQLSLDPLDFGFAGGHLKTVITLDGRQSPLQARARIGVREVQLSKLFPSVPLTRASLGQINGRLELAGRGNSVGQMLASSNGSISLIAVDGKVSKLLMEQMGLHLLEILQLKLMGDRQVKLNCAVVDFGVKQGVLRSRTLVLDTEVNTLIGQGSIDLAQEKIDLTLLSKTKTTSALALRTPFHLSGTFAKPVLDLDRARILARGVGALALGVLNPALALIPLVELGPGVKSECERHVKAAR